MKDSKLKIKEGFILKTIAENHFVMPVGKQTIDFNCMITLNETGAFLWKMLEQETSRQQLLDAMLNEYDIDSDKALADIDKFLETLKKDNLLC